MQFQRIRDWLAENRRAWIVFAGSVAAAVAVRSGALPNGWAVAAVLLSAFLAVCWFWPAIAAGVLLVVAASSGSVFIVVAAPLVMLLAAVGARRAELPRERLWGLKLVGLVVAAFLLTLPFVDWTIGEQAGGGGAQPIDQFIDDGPGGSEPGWFARLLERLLGQGGDEAPRGDGPGGSPPPPPPDESFDWWIVAAIVGVLLLAGLMLWWWLRRRRAARSDLQPGWSLARLEGIGTALGRPRDEHEGPISYASELADLTGDRRLVAVGPLVSAGTYESPTADDERTEHDLAGIEASPPPKPPRPRRSLRAMARSRAARLVLLGTLAVAAVGVLVWFVATRSDRFGDEPSGDAAASMFATVLDAPPASIERWEACGVWAGGGTFSSVGLRSGDAAVVERSIGIGADGWTQWWALVDGAWRHQTSQGEEHGLPWTEWPADPFLSDTFASVGSVVAAHGADGESAEQREGFVRYETGPDWMVDAARPPRHWLAGTPFLETAWVLDVWADDGRPDRVRWMGDGLEGGGWFEWRLTDPDERGGLAVDCPADPAVVDGGVWVGSEPWDLTVAVDPRIAFDDRGNPYAFEWWQQSGEPADRVSADRVAVDGDLHLAPLYGLSAGAAAARLPALAGDDVLIVRHGNDGLIVAVSLEVPDRAVERWVSQPTGIVFDDEPLLLSWGDLPVLDHSTIDSLEWWANPVTRIDATSLVVDASLFEVEVATGFDADGVAVAVVLWSTDRPWRLLGLAGEPPTAVAEREVELWECLEGARPVDATGWCTEG